MKKIGNVIITLLVVISVFGSVECFAESVGTTLNGKKTAETLPLANTTKKFRYTVSAGTRNSGSIEAYIGKGNNIDEITKKVKFCKLSAGEVCSQDLTEKSYNFVRMGLYGNTKESPKTGYVGTALISQR